MNYEVKYENNTNYSETDTNTNKYETECDRGEPMKLRRILNVKLILICIH